MSGQLLLLLLLLLLATTILLLTPGLPSDVSGVAEVLDRPLRLRDRKMVQHSGFGVSGSSL